MMNQKWVTKPGAIPHIQHFYQPQHAWMEWMQFQTECVDALLHVLRGDAWRSDMEVTMKIDDGMSVKVAHPSEHVWGVGYKTGPLLQTYDEIDDFYHSKPYVAEKLKPLLDRAPMFFVGGDVGCEYQLGFLGYDPNGITGTLKPNVIEYNTGSRPGHRLYVSKVSATKNGKFIPFYASAKEPSFGKDLCIISPEVYTIGGNSDAIRIIENIIRAGIHHPMVVDNASFHIVMKQHISDIKKFFNKMVRESNGDDSDVNVMVDKFLKGSVSADMRENLILAMTEISNQKMLSDYITKKTINHSNGLQTGIIGRLHEGLVFTKYLDGGAQAIIGKMVDPTYTKLNYETWNKK